MFRKMKSRPIKATPTLYGKDAERFLIKVEEGLRHPTGPVPTPKIDAALERIHEEIEKRRMHNFWFGEVALLKKENN